MGVAVAVGARVAVGEMTEVGVADGSGVAVAVGWSKGMGMDSLQDATTSDKANVMTRRNQVAVVRTRRRGLCSRVRSSITVLYHS
jgi:hypothetical protein